MSQQARVPFGEAMAVFSKLSEPLEAFGSVVPVGSLRRCAELVGDIDAHLLSSHLDVPKIRRAVHGMGSWERGGDRLMVVDNVLGSGLKLELTIVYPPRNWYSMLAIRTGPAEFEQWTRGRLLARGHARPHGELKATSEQDFFERLLGIPYVMPIVRTPEWVRGLP